MSGGAASEERAKWGPGVPGEGQTLADVVVSDDVLMDLTRSVVVLCEQFDALMGAVDWPARRRVAAQIDQHLNCIWSDVGVVRAWLVLNSPDLHGAAGDGTAAGAAGGPGDDS